MTNKPVIAVVGLGAMGLGIAQLFAQAGHDVFATDSQISARSNAQNRASESLQARVEAGRLTADQRDATLERLHIVETVAALAPSALVIEAIAENLAAKQALFAELEGIVGPHCVLASNTSSLSIAAIMCALTRSQRGLGLHFFNPVAAMKLAELVLPPHVDPAAAELARTIAQQAGKTVIACADTPGFIVNRCARPFYGEALAMLEQGRRPGEIDAALQNAGYRLGPFSLIDLVGADINLAATESLSTAMQAHPRYHVFEALKTQVASGNLGRKSGRGFLFPQEVETAPPDAEDIVLRIEAMLANEAASLAAEGVVSPHEIDTAVRLGLNFPRGPFEAARAHGVPRVKAKLDALAETASPALKHRYQILPFLETLP